MAQLGAAAKLVGAIDFCGAVMLTVVQRAALLQQNPCVVWFTGLSGAGKSTIADLVEVALHQQGKHTYVLDADRVRAGLNRDLGFSPADRQENVRRMAECAYQLADAGLMVLVTSISPYTQSRDDARKLLSAHRFVEVFVDTPVETVRQRDPKGLYARFARGQINQIAGLDAPYERPVSPELTLSTTILSADQCAQQVLRCLG
jgi:adenylyl-sulfate kinase